MTRNLRNAQFVLAFGLHKKILRADGDFCGITDWLLEGAFINEDDVDALHALFHKTQRARMHVFPRLSLFRRWVEVDTVLDTGVGSFAQEVRAALSLAQDCWSDRNVK